MPLPSANAYNPNAGTAYAVTWCRGQWTGSLLFVEWNGVLIMCLK